MISIKNFLWVGLGGGIGAMLRFFMSSFFKPGAFPLSTFLINIIGSLLIGMIYALSVRNDGLSEQMRLFLATGICGGFTTFSAFSLENLLLLKSGNYTTALLYMISSVALCILACLAGFKIIQH